MDFKEFLNKIRKRNGEKLLKKSKAIYVSYIERFAEEINSKKTNEELIEWVNKKITSTEGSPPMKGAFVQYLKFLGVDDEQLKHIKSPQRRASALTSLRELSAVVIPLKDMKLLFNTLEGDMKLIIGLYYETACREQEILNVKVKDITFYDAPRKNLGCEILVFGKGSKNRTVFISNKLTEMVKNHIKTKKIKDADRLITFRHKDGRLYLREDKKLYDEVCKATKRIIGKSYSIHKLRHTRATHLADKGADVKGISNLLGHSGLQTTSIYVKHSSLAGRNTVESYSEEL